MPMVLSQIPTTFAEEQNEIELIGYSNSYNMHIPIKDGCNTFKNFTWYLYLPSSTMVIHTTPAEEIIVNEILAEGFYKFNYEYIPTKRMEYPIVWEIGNDRIEYTVFGGNTPKQIIEKESNNLIIVEEDTILNVTKSWLDREELKTALICVVCSLLPSLPIISILKRRSNNGYEPIV